MGMEKIYYRAITFEGNLDRFEFLKNEFSEQLRKVLAEKNEDNPLSLHRLEEINTENLKEAKQIYEDCRQLADEIEDGLTILNKKYDKFIADYTNSKNLIDKFKSKVRLAA